MTTGISPYEATSRRRLFSSRKISALFAPDKLRGIFGYRIEHRLNRRVRDDVQYLRGGSLLLLTLRDVTIQVSILQCDRGLRGQQL
jgi:hypothetical protein